MLIDASQSQLLWSLVPKALLLTSLLVPPTGLGCQLFLAEHRSGRPLGQLALDPVRPAADLAFTHSVLGTPVLDRYVWRAGPLGWRAHLVEERFEGEGYGLPSSAGPGEALVRDGKGWRLYLDRLVDPLVVAPLPAQSMRLVMQDNTEILLGSLSQQSVEIRVQHCPNPE